LRSGSRPAQCQTLAEPAEVDRSIETQITTTDPTSDRFIEPAPVVIDRVWLRFEADVGSVLAQRLEVAQDPRIEATARHAPGAVGRDDRSLEATPDPDRYAGPSEPIESDELGTVPEPRQRLVRSSELVDDLRPRCFSLRSERDHPKSRSHRSTLERGDESIDLVRHPTRP